MFPVCRKCKDEIIVNNGVINESFILNLKCIKKGISIILNNYSIDILILFKSNNNYYICNIIVNI